jgi:hypothetical protein
MLNQQKIKTLILLLLVGVVLSGCFLTRDNSNIFVENFTNAETHHGSRSFILLRNGDTIYGNQKERFLASKTFVYGVPYRNKRIRSKFDLHFYFHRVKGGFARRIIRGKINVYSRHYKKGEQDLYAIYLQKGEDAEPVEAKTFEDYRKQLRDCPLAIQTIDDELARKKRHLNQFTYFLSTAILIYNKDCKPI